MNQLTNTFTPPGGPAPVPLGCEPENGGKRPVARAMAMKKDRELIFNKYGGRCAYCGCELEKGWHVDEVQPVRRNSDGTCLHPERFRLDNQNPACASCNINKHSMGLEEFRQLIANFMRSLSLYSVQYRIAKRYGLVQEIEQPVVFYFETLPVSPETRKCKPKT